MKRFFIHILWQRAIICLTLFLFPLCYLAKQAFFDPDIEFLVPSLTAEWALHPVQEILNLRNGRASRDVEFARDFAVADASNDLILKIRAFNTPRVWLNGAEIFPEANGRNWKRPIRYHLGQNLQRKNRLRIRIQNYGALPALLVEEPEFLRTPDRWQASLEPDFDDFRAAVTSRIQSRRSGPLQRWPGWRWAKWLTVFWLIGIISLTAWAILARLFGGEKQEEACRVTARWARIAVPSVLIGASLWLNLANAEHYPNFRSVFDTRAHISYVQRMSRTWTPPIATEGWQMFQPPGYYYAASGVFRACGGEEHQARALKCVQYFGSLSGVALALLAWLYARHIFPNDPSAQWIALGFAAFLPMSLYMNPVITNEVFAASVIAAATYALLRSSQEKKSGIGTAAFLGFAVSYGLMTKYGGLFAVIVGAMGFGLRAVDGCRRRELSCLAMYVGVVVLLCGWYYGRNAQLFGDPFVGNWDVARFHYEQIPSYRTVGFYTEFGRVFIQHPEANRWTTWLDGNYASMWADGHNNFFNNDDERAHFLQSVTIILAAFPSAAIVLGIGVTLYSVLRQPASNPDLALFGVPWLTWLSLISFTMEVPTYSTVKAFFFLSLVPCMAVFLLRGRALFDRHLRKGRYLLDGTIGIVCFLAFMTYRFPG